MTSPAEVDEWQDVPNYIVTEALSDGRVLFADDKRPYTLMQPTDELLVAEGGKRKQPADLTKLWFRRAEKDITACCKLLESKGSYELVCFSAQQAAEKFLKGFLALHKRKFNKEHDLEKLLGLCGDLMSQAEFSDLELNTLSEYAWARYSLSFHPSEDIAEEALERALKVREVVLARVPVEALP